MSLFLLAMELIGTAAFAVSGAMIALQRQMDLLGVCILGVISACGGGVLRDILLGRLPPAMFQQPVYALTAIGVSAVIFLPSVHRMLAREHRMYERVMLWADSLGLGIFSAAGVAATIAAGYGENLLFCVFLGTVTGVGGGVIRDNLAGLPPYIFVKHIYACASCFGALLCRLLWSTVGETAAALLCCAAVFTIRLLASHYRWSLPKSDLKADMPAAR